METKDLILKWEARLKNHRVAHYVSARYYEGRHKLLGVPVVIVSAVVGSAVFGTIGYNANVWIQGFAGILSLSAVVLSSLQTFLSFSELSERHLVAATKYTALFRELQFTKATKADESISSQYLDDFRIRWDEVDLEAPTLKKSVYRNIENEVDTA